MSTSERDIPEAQSGSDLERLGSILVRLIVGIAFLVGAAYIFRHPIVSMDGGLFGVGFYVLFAVLLGCVTLYTAYSKTRFASDDRILRSY